MITRGTVVLHLRSRKVRQLLADELIRLNAQPRSTHPTLQQQIHHAAVQELMAKGTATPKAVAGRLYRLGLSAPSPVIETELCHLDANLHYRLAA